MAPVVRSAGDGSARYVMASLVRRLDARGALDGRTPAQLRWREEVTMPSGTKVAPGKCAVAICDRQRNFADGMCKAHHDRVYRLRKAGVQVDISEYLAGVGAGLRVRRGTREMDAAVLTAAPPGAPPKADRAGMSPRWEEALLDAVITGTAWSAVAVQQKRAVVKALLELD